MFFLRLPQHKKARASAAPTSPLAMVPKGAPRRRRYSRRLLLGQGLVEFAFLLPTLLLILLGAIDLGRVFYAYAAISNAAYQAARQSARGGYLFTACKSTNGVSCDASLMSQ